MKIISKITCLFKNEKGALLAEHQIFIVMSAILVFGAGSLVINGIIDYFNTEWKGNVGEQGQNGQLNDINQSPIKAPPQQNGKFIGQQP